MSLRVANAPVNNVDDVSLIISRVGRINSTSEAYD